MPKPKLGTRRTAGIPVRSWGIRTAMPGKKIALLDFDGYNYDSEEAMRKQYVSYLNKCKREKVEPKYDESDFLKIKCVKDVVNCPFLLAGHGFAIKMLLQGDIAVNEDGTVTDITGVLAD